MFRVQVDPVKIAGLGLSGADVLKQILVAMNLGRHR